ncbi:putative porin [Acinetobacter bohemicus]|uniref:Porin n=1 Tax=Acinetobacter lwoffii TaxID=28090 RepID=A0A9D2UQS9_ACILW|nr:MULTISPECIES: putative porin [unclassified Acinetobacter]MDM1782590.1 putative porin [Acinetobacter indicus]HJF26995.1 putative porin [Acinetobacter lwoffii]MCO8044808.1 putative porin [Acinetobacter sp. S4397-1]QKQ71135.1 putative porin [Acinetobacter sp. 10FS3-1]TSH76923.1 putative porin [Acinetobacter sp. RF15A]
MLKKLTLATALIASLGTAHAYQAEVGGTIALVDPDNGDTSTGFAIDGTYYFNPVQVKNSPLNEAAFLNRASNINAAVSYIDYDLFDVTTFNVGVEYFVPNSDFYVSGNIGQSSTDTPIGDDDTTLYSAELGYLPVPGLLVAVGLAGYDNDAGDDVDPTLRAKYVTQVGQYDMNFEGGASFGDLDAYNLGADLYLDKTFSVGLGFSDSDLENSDVFTIRAKKFFTQQVSLEGSIDFADEGNIFGVRGAYRF